MEKRSLLARVLGVPNGKSTLYWIIEKQNRWWVQLLAFAGFVALFWIVFGNFGQVAALFIAIILHEIGHYVVFRRSGIKTILLFLFPLGAMAAPATEEENKRSDELPWWSIAWLLLMGPAMNVLLIILGRVMIALDFWPVFARQMVDLNTLLAIFNLLPVWNLDGGQFFKVMFASLDESNDKVLQAGMILFLALVLLFVFLPQANSVQGLLLAIWNNAALLFFALALAICSSTKHGKDATDLFKSKQAMTPKQVSFLGTVYVFITLIIFVCNSLPY